MSFGDSILNSGQGFAITTMSPAHTDRGGQGGGWDSRSVD